MNKIKFTDIPRYFKGLPHQIAALNYLQDNTPDSVQGQFVEIWRSAVPDKVQDVSNSWTGVMQAAGEAGARYPELVAAQWAQESGWGKYLSGRHNYFGQKGTGGKYVTWEEVNGKKVPVVDEFIHFESLRQSVQYLVDRWYKDYEHNGKRYEGVNRAPDREAAARMLLAEGYATDSNYANALIALMRRNAPQVEVPPPARITPASSFAIRLTPHIRLGEFALDQEARRFVAQHQVDTAGEIAAFLERVRARFNAAINITSGFRPPAINRAVNGATDSEHLYSVPREGAVDFWMSGVDFREVYRWCDQNWPHSLGDASYKPEHERFIHLGRRANGVRRRWNYG
jgi:hypothetical protein